MDGIANAQWDLALLELRRGQGDRARPRIEQAWSLFRRTGRVEGIAIIGSTLGPILHNAGELDRAREVLTLAARCWRKLGREAKARELEGLVRAPHS